MKSSEKGMPWWLDLIVGLLLITAGILLLANQTGGFGVLIFLVGLGVFVYGLFSIYKALHFKDDNRLFIPYLAQGLLDMVLLLLIIMIGDKTPLLLGIIMGCWMIVFGFFELVHARRTGGDRQRRRIGILLLLAGIALIIITSFLQDGYIIFLGIIALAAGIFKTVQGILGKIRSNDSSAGGRSRLL